MVRRAGAVCARSGATALVVFDPTAERVSEVPAVSVRVADPGLTADDVIRSLVDRAPEPPTVVVVSSDKPLYSYARTRGARVMRAHEWNAFERTLRL